MKIKKGDTVAVIAGKDKGRSGRVIEVLREADRVRVEGLAKYKRHQKAGRTPSSPEGGIVEKTGTIHVSNVMLVDPASKKPTRVGQIIEDGKKLRVGRGKLKGVRLDAK